MNKRDVMFSLLEDNTQPPYVPAAFFLHFPPGFQEGQAAIEKHLEFFHYTGMDFVKIQYERPFPPIPSIQRPEDWAKMPRYGRDFYEGQLNVVDGLVKAAKHEAVIVVTLYSPYMSAGHTTSDALLTNISSRHRSRFSVAGDHHREPAVVCARVYCAGCGWLLPLHAGRRSAPFHRQSHLRAVRQAV
jgi:hypothetical protein